MKRGRVWDPLVRLFHWSLVAAFATAWFTPGESAHEIAGHFVIALIIFRAAWGIAGTGAARFANFVQSPSATLRYVFDIAKNRPQHFSGHNPAGAAMIIALMITLVVTAGSGIAMSSTAFWGNETVEWVHGTAANAMIVLIAGHVLGVVIAMLQHRENLVLSMISGRKWVAQGTLAYLGNPNFTLRAGLGAAAVIAVSVSVWAGAYYGFNASLWRMNKLIAAGASDAGCGAVTTQGPRVEIYPALAMVYDVKQISGGGAQVFGVTLAAAAQRRPALDFRPLGLHCMTIHDTHILAAQLPKFDRPVPVAAEPPRFGPSALDIVTSALTPPPPAPVKAAEDSATVEAKTVEAATIEISHLLLDHMTPAGEPELSAAAQALLVRAPIWPEFDRAVVIAPAVEDVPKTTASRRKAVTKISRTKRKPSARRLARQFGSGSAVGSRSGRSGNQDGGKGGGKGTSGGGTSGGGGGGGGGTGSNSGRDSDNSGSGSGSDNSGHGGGGNSGHGGGDD